MALREELQELHWSYMEGYAAEMVARGPTLTDDGETATGSVHIVGLSGPSAARAFAFDEPNYQAGVYRDALLRLTRQVRLLEAIEEAPGGCFLARQGRRRPGPLRKFRGGSECSAPRAGPS
jgi:uncharacterized protein YciI